MEQLILKIGIECWGSHWSYQIYNAAEHLIAKSYVLMHKNVFFKTAEKIKQYKNVLLPFFDCFFF